MDTALPTLVIFCKRPALHHGKQRLAQSLGSEAAYDIARAMLACALEDAADWPGPLVLAVSEATDVAWAHTLMPGRYQVLAQGEGGLGQRLNRIDLNLRAARQSQLVFIGTDAPALTQAHYAQAIERIAQTDIVLSPARDGGVTLMANARPWPYLADLPWSTRALGASLKLACRRLGYAVDDIDGSYDIDVAADLDALRHDLKTDHRPARRQLLATLPTLTDTTAAPGGRFRA